jgi:zinc protease
MRRLRLRIGAVSAGRGNRFDRLLASKESEHGRDFGPPGRACGLGYTSERTFYADAMTIPIDPRAAPALPVAGSRRARTRTAGVAAIACAAAVTLAFVTVPAGARSPAPTAGQATQEAAFRGPEASERVLPNGMKVLVQQDNRAPTAVHMVWYRAGSIDEVNGRTGVAHVLEHMMFKGTDKLAAGEFSRRVAQMGGRENAFTSRDYTGYFQQIHKSRLAEVMALESERMTRLRLTEEEFAKEIRVVMEERRLRTEDRAAARLYETLMATTFVAHPYRHPIIGWMSDLESMTVADAQAWYDAWYAPNNALLVVAGDVEPDEVFRLAEQTYGRIASRALPPRKPQTEPPQRGVKRLQVKAPAENPYVAMAFHVPRLESVEADREPFALEMLSSVLSAGDSARLTREVVRSARVANRAGAGYDLTQRGPALFVLDGTPADGRTTEEVEKALRAQIARIASEGVPDSELERVKVQYVSSQVYKRDSVFAQAMEIAGLEIAGYSHRDADRILERVRTVTSDEVKAVAAKYFGDDALTVATLIPQPIGERKPAEAIPGLRH